MLTFTKFSFTKLASVVPRFPNSTPMFALENGVLGVPTGNPTPKDMPNSFIDWLLMFKPVFSNRNPAL